MKIAFLNPPFIRTVDRRQRCTGNVPQGWAHPPIGFAYIASYIYQQNNIKRNQVKIFDSSGLSISEKQTFNQLKKFSPDIILTNIGIYTYKSDLKFLKKIKSELTSKIIVFGEFITSFPKKFLQENKFIDIIISGEPEIPFSKYLSYLNKKIKIQKVPSIFYRKSGKIKANKQEKIKKLDDLPLPDRTLINNKIYKCMPFFASPYTDLVTSRGCPYNCLFCTSKGFWGNYRSRSAENILKEVKQVIKKYNIKNFFMTDEIFGKNKDVYKLLRGFKKLGIKFAMETRVDTVNEKLLKEMGKSGCIYIHYGAESGSQKILNYYRKGITVKQIKQAVKWSKKAGIETCATFIIGNPIETRQDVEKTINLAKNLKLDYVHFGPMIPFPLSDSFKQYKKQGILKHENWEKYTKPNVVYQTKYIKEKEIKQLIKKAYRKTNFTPGYVLRRLKNIIKTGNPKMIKEHLVAATWLLKTFVSKKN